jgi:hypothetical protein
VHTGRARTVLVGLVGREDEISQFRSANHFTRFFLADSRGNVALRSLASGERLKDFRGHSSEVLALKPDLINGILLTAAWDHLAVQDGATGELLRELIHF